MGNFKTIALAFAAAAVVATASDVHDLKKDTFPTFVKENDLVLAECECLLGPSYSEYC